MGSSIQDDVVPLEQSQILYNRLKSCNIPVTLIVMKNSTHILDLSSANWKENVEKIVSYFDKYLKQL